MNAGIGKGLTMTIDERKRMAEEWLKACRKLSLTCIVSIGGSSIVDVLDLAEHAESIGVDAVLVLPDLFYRPTCEEDLVHYLQQVAQRCPTRPLLYYHIPIQTHVNRKLRKRSKGNNQLISFFRYSVSASLVSIMPEGYSNIQWHSLRQPRFGNRFELPETRLY